MHSFIIDGVCEAWAHQHVELRSARARNTDRSSRSSASATSTPGCEGALALRLTSGPLASPAFRFGPMVACGGRAQMGKALSARHATPYTGHMQNQVSHILHTLAADHTRQQACRRCDRSLEAGRVSARRQLAAGQRLDQPLAGSRKCGMHLRMHQVRYTAAYVSSEPCVGRRDPVPPSQQLQARQRTTPATTARRGRLASR